MEDNTLKSTSHGSVAFDVDGTLVDYHDKPRMDVLSLLTNFKRLGFKVIVWSGGGYDYAKTWVYKLGIAAFVDEIYDKHDLGRPVPDMCFDDERVSLADKNFMV